MEVDQQENKYMPAQMELYRQGSQGGQQSISKEVVHSKLNDSFGAEPGCQDIFSNNVIKPQSIQINDPKSSFKKPESKEIESQKQPKTLKRPRRQEDEFDHFASFSKPRKRVCIEEIGIPLQGSGYPISAALSASASDVNGTVNSAKQKSIDVREGELKLGDEPNQLKNCVVMEGEVFWRVKWNKNEQTKVLDSYESQESLQIWNFNRFELLRQQSLDKSN